MSCAPAGGPPGAVHDAPDVVDQFEPTDQSLPLVPDPPIQVHTVDDDEVGAAKGMDQTPRP